MSAPRGRAIRRNTGAGISIGLAAAGTTAWVLQHRAVRLAEATANETVVDEGLALPNDLTHHFVDVPDGGRLHVMERGEGPPLVLLHGLMLSSALWVHQLRDLADRHRVITVDLSGHGQSILGTGRYTADGRDLASPAVHRLAADVWAVLEALDVRDALLVGHSMGGMTALQLALDVPTLALRRRVAGLALVSTTAGPFSSLPRWPTVARFGGKVSSRVVLAAERYGARSLPSRDLRWWVSRLGFGADAAPAQVQFVERMHVSSSSRVFGELLPSLAAFDISDRLHEIDLPALVVVGTHDRVIGPVHARRLADGLARAELVELPRCGHQPMLERRNEFSRLIDEFSAKLG
jgi:pimeloyl-ACP methyl ester carboxylesterase